MKPIWSSALESMGNHFKEKHLKYLRLFILLRILLQLLGARLLRDNLVCNTMHLTSKRLVYLFRTVCFSIKSNENGFRNKVGVEEQVKHRSFKSISALFSGYQTASNSFLGKKKKFPSSVSESMRDH